MGHESNTVTTGAQPAKQYHHRKLLLSGSQFLLTAAFLLLCVVTPLSRWMAVESGTMIAETPLDSPYGQFLLFVCGLGLLHGGISLPLRYYGGFVLEHQYGLSNQTRGRWARESLKHTGVGVILMMPVACLLLWVLRNWVDVWWIIFAAGLFGFSVALGVIAPKILLPLFYRVTPLDAGSLKTGLQAMGEAVGLEIAQVQVIDMSRNTKKANAALTGLGKARRVILGDTLVAQFSENEIRAVFAHELGHYRLGHLPKQMLFSGVSTFAAMGFAGWLYAALAGRFGFQGITDIAATPVLALVLMLYGLVTIPLGNWWSRRHEWQADDYALETTQDPAAYITCMEKLRDLNLADPAPHPWIERLFHSHPSIGKRIAHARNFQAGMTD